MMRYIKYSFLFVFLFFFLASFAQKRLKDKDIYTLNGRHYYKNKPLNGTYKVKFGRPNEHFSEITTYTDGLKKSVKRLRFNKLEEEGNYVNDKKEGTWKEYAYTTGILVKVSNYTNGKKEGLELVYSGVSDIDSLCYVNGVLDGIQLKNSYNGRTETLYDKGIVISSVRHTNDGQIAEKCQYNGYLGNDKECVVFRRKTNGHDVFLYTDSIFVNANYGVLKCYLNNQLEYQIKVLKATEKYNLVNNVIFYYEKDKLVMINEDEYPKTYLVFDPDRQLELINSKILTDGFRSIYNWEFTCGIAFWIYYGDRLFTYRLRKDGTFTKYVNVEIEGSGDMLGGCKEKEVEVNAKIPALNYEWKH